MKIALFIHSYAGANETVKRHWPYYKRSGMDLFGVGRTDKKCLWPEPIPTREIGVDGYIGDDNLPRRLVDTFDWFLTDPRFKPYTHACIVEYDGIFLRAPEIDPEIEIAAHHAGGPIPGYHANSFYHCPWLLIREAAETFVSQGRILINLGEYENGSPDFFFKWVWETLNWPVKHLAGTFSRNSLDILSDQMLCRDLIRTNSVWFVHGVKTAAQLEKILS